VAAGTRDGALPAPTCSEVISGGSTPDVLIASDLALQGVEAADPRASADIIRSVLKDHDFRAGKYAVGYQSCDDSTAQTGGYEERKCAANANAYTSARKLVAVIGPYNSGCARVEIPILDRTPAGPLAMISPSNDQPDLTRGGRLALPPPLGTRGAPAVYYPTGVRNYVRLLAPDYLQGVAQAMLAKKLGLDGVYLLHDPTTAGDVSWTGPFRRTASRLGVRIAGSAAFDPAAKSYDVLARKVARSRADGVLIGGELHAGGDRLLRALRARLGPRATLMSGEGFTPIPDVLTLAGRAAKGLYVATSDVPPDALDLTLSGQRFTREFGSAAQSGFALQTAQATEVVLRAIAQSDGTRASVLRAIRATHVRNGLLGSFSFDRYGDITPPKITVLRITGSTPADVHLPTYLLGAVVDRVFTVPPNLGE
jgi:branched-chain amino acid transport system substrate-binding protein